MQELKNMEQKFKTVVLGGTFDHLHKGHKEFIKFGLFVSEKIILAITSDDYVNKQKAERRERRAKNFENYEERKKALEDFIASEKVKDRVEIVKIDDVYGIAISPDINLDAIVVVDKTSKGADLVNSKRKQLGLKPLEVVIAPTEKAEDGTEISSSRIRNGEIDRNGKLYINPTWLTQDLYLPDRLREELRKPLGELFENKLVTARYTGILDNERLRGNLVITVGDITTQTFNKMFIRQKISIIDLNVNRKKIFDKVSELGFLKSEKIVNVKNQPGQISYELFSAVALAFRQRERVIIQVEGEEDLAVLPAVLAAPLGAEVFYGQPDRGVVGVKITEEIKNKAYSFVSQFNTRGH